MANTSTILNIILIINIIGVIIYKQFFSINTSISFTVIEIILLIIILVGILKSIIFIISKKPSEFFTVLFAYIFILVISVGSYMLIDLYFRIVSNLYNKKNVLRNYYPYNDVLYIAIVSFITLLIEYILNRIGIIDMREEGPIQRIIGNADFTLPENLSAAERDDLNINMSEIDPNDPSVVSLLDPERQQEAIRARREARVQILNQRAETIRENRRRGIFTSEPTLYHI